MAVRLSVCARGAPRTVLLCVVVTLPMYSYKPLESREDASGAGETGWELRGRGGGVIKERSRGGQTGEGRTTANQSPHRGRGVRDTVVAAGNRKAASEEARAHDHDHAETTGSHSTIVGVGL